MDCNEFIQKYFAAFLEQSRARNPYFAEDQLVSIPPCSKELEQLLSYLLENEVDFVITDTLAVIKYLRPSSQNIHERVHRPISKIVLLISKSLPPVLENWQEVKVDSENVTWITPSQGSVEFQKVEDFENLSRDPESIASNCPILNYQNLFREKLNVKRHRDLVDLLCLAENLGVPSDIDENLNEKQSKNLSKLKQWLARRLKNGGKIYE